MAEFAYNNEMYSSTKTLSFKVNYGQNPRMGFEGRKKGKYEEAEKFVERMKKNTEESKSSARKSTRGYKEVC